MSDSLWPRGLSPWNSLGQNTGMGRLSLLQGIFPTQESNRGLLHGRGFFTSWAIREAKSLTLVVCFLLPLKRERNDVWHLQPISSIWRPLAFLPVPVSFPPFSFRRIMLPRKRYIVPKLLRQHILILRVSNPGAPSSSWKKLPQWQEFEQPFVTWKPSCS